MFVIPLPVGRREVRARHGVPAGQSRASCITRTSASIGPTPRASSTMRIRARVTTGCIAHSAVYPDGHFLGWTPGQVPPLLPKGLAWRSQPDTDLVVELHMQPSGKAEAVQPSIGFYFGDRSARADAGDAAARAAEHRHSRRRARTTSITDSFVLPVDVEVQAVQPHAHYRAQRHARRRHAARRLDAAAHPHPRLGLPLAARLSLRHAVLRCRKARRSRCATRTTTRADNPRNPTSRRSASTGASARRDEMGDLWIQVLTRNDQRSAGPQRPVRAEGDDRRHRSATSAGSSPSRTARRCTTPLHRSTCS